MLNFRTFPFGGCWGQSMLLFWKLVDETQISKPPEPTRHHNSIKLLIPLSLRAELLFTLHYEIPCRCKKESFWKDLLVIRDKWTISTSNRCNSVIDLMKINSNMITNTAHSAVNEKLDWYFDTFSLMFHTS